jgi:hypothetical protein
MPESVQWNGIMGEGCNLPIDCVHCDIVECGGRSSEFAPLWQHETKGCPFMKNCANAPCGFCYLVLFTAPFDPLEIEVRVIEMDCFKERSK